MAIDPKRLAEQRAALAPASSVDPVLRVYTRGRLEPMLIRVPPALAADLRDLAKRTRVPQAVYLREAVTDLLAKYSARREEPTP